MEAAEIDGAKQMADDQTHYITCTEFAYDYSYVTFSVGSIMRSDTGLFYQGNKKQRVFFIPQHRLSFLCIKCNFQEF